MVERASEPIGPKWNCSNCTFENPASKDTCEMCYTSKSGSGTHVTPPAQAEAPPPSAASNPVYGYGASQPPANIGAAAYGNPNPAVPVGPAGPYNKPGGFAP